MWHDPDLHTAIHRLYNRIERMECYIMAALDDLNTAVTQLGDAITSLTSTIDGNDAAIQKEIEALIAAGASGNDGAVRDIATRIANYASNIKSASDRVAQETKSLTDSLPPAAPSSTAPTQGTTTSAPTP